MKKDQPSNGMETLRIVKIDNFENSIRIMLNTAVCVYFHKFGKTIYTEIQNDLIQKKTFSEFKKDILKYNWNVDELRKIWCNLKN